MVKRLREFGREGKKVGEVVSSNGQAMYTIYEDNGRLNCECVSFQIRKRCRHLREYAKQVGKAVCPNSYCRRLCPEEEIRSFGECIRCNSLP